MASVLGNHTITEYNINATVESEDGRTRLSSNGSGVATINVTVDRGAVGVVNAIQFNPLNITFPAEITADLTGVKQYTEIERPAYIAGRATPVGIYTTEIEVVPGFPIDLSSEYFDVNAVDDKGTSMVCTMLSNGTLTGDINESESYYDSLMGYLYIVWNRPLRQGQNIIYRKNYTDPPADPVEFTLTGLVGYSTLLTYTLAAKTFDSSLGTHTPIAPGSVVLTATLATGVTATVTDDSNGNLIGLYVDTDNEYNEENANTINYQTGEINITFDSTLMTGEPITLKHTSLVPVKSYRIPSTNKQNKIRITLPWEDLARIVKSVEQTAGIVETGLKYRADT